MLTNLIIQAIAGAIGGNAAGAASKDLTLGTLANTIVGAIGGGVGGQILTGTCCRQCSAARPTWMLGLCSAKPVGGGVSGAVVTAVVGAHQESRWPDVRRPRTAQGP